MNTYPRSNHLDGGVAIVTECFRDSDVIRYTILKVEKNRAIVQENINNHKEVWAK